MRTESRASATSSLYPAAAAIAFIALFSGTLWWQTRPEPVRPMPLAHAPAPQKAATQAKPAPVPSQVLAFATFAGQEAPAEWPASRAFTANGIRLMADAIAARGDSTLWRDRAKRLVEAAVEIESAADPAQAAKAAHGALAQAAEWIADLRAVALPGAADPVLSTAQAIAPNELLREQGDELERFFDAAAKALEGSDRSA